MMQAGLFITRKKKGKSTTTGHSRFKISGHNRMLVSNISTLFLKSLSHDTFLGNNNYNKWVSRVFKNRDILRLWQENRSLSFSLHMAIRWYSIRIWLIKMSNPLSGPTKWKHYKFRSWPMIHKKNCGLGFILHPPCVYFGF